jgi:hypothetical protein
MTPHRTLDAQVRRFRAGEVYTPSNDTDSVSWLRVMGPILSMAAADLDNQLDRLDDFSLPLWPATTPRTSPARTAQLFLSQLRSDFRRVAAPSVDLADVELQRQTHQWVTALEKHGIKNRPVAILAVGQYLALDQTEDVDLEVALKPWLGAADHSDKMEWFETTFGPVVGPLVHLALSRTPEAPQQLPRWASKVGDDWCHQFLTAGAQELRRAHQQPAPAIQEQIGGQWESQRKAITDLIEQQRKAQQKAITDLIEQQRRSGKLAEHWEAQRKALTDQVEQQWNAQLKAITDLAERQWDAQKKAIEDAQNAIGGVFRPKPE